MMDTTCRWQIPTSTRRCQFRQPNNNNNNAVFSTPLSRKRSHISYSRRVKRYMNHACDDSKDCMWQHQYRLLPGGGGFWWLQQGKGSADQTTNHSTFGDQDTYAIHGEQFVLQRRLTTEEQTRALSVFMSNTDLVPLSQEKRNSVNVHMVLVERSQEDSDDASRMECFHPKSPRRTQRVSFTCKLCEERNVNRPVNPDAWKTGSVFIRCHCGAVHKMKDNLKIFHELYGDVFPPVHHRESFLVQEILDRIKDKNTGTE